MSLIKHIIDSVLLTSFTYKKGALIILSFPISLLLDFLINGEFLGVGMMFIMFFFLLIIVDFFTGIIAARYNGEEIESSKIAYTFYKIFFYVSFFTMTHLIKKELIRQTYWIYDQFIHGLNVITLTVLILLVLREYISIGENIHKRFKKKPEIFKLVDKVADTIEKRLIKKIADSDFCENNDKKDEDK
jgi:hypothetical protein